MASSLAERVEMRAATAADLPDISRIMNYPPEPPMATLLGSDRSSRLGDLAARNGLSIALVRTAVAVVDGAVAGFLDCGSQTGVRPTVGQILRLIPQALIILGPATPRAVYGMWLRKRVQFEEQESSFPVALLYVDEALRNRGIGGRLLQYAERVARDCGASRMCLETGVTNPARRLYERYGFEVIATKTDRSYERMTGSPGRILMTKRIVGK